MLYNPKPGSSFLPALFAAIPTPATDVHITADTTLSADLFCISLVVDAGITLSTNNRRIFCLGAVLNNGTIANNGGAGGAGTAIAGGAAGSNSVGGALPRGLAGGAGKIGAFNGGNAASCANYLGYTPKNGGSTGLHTGGTGTAFSTAIINGFTFYMLTNIFSIPYILSGGSLAFTPGGGGGGGAADVNDTGSGGGGAGGGHVFIVCSTLLNSGLISANGGDGGNAFQLGPSPAGGGASGNGGIIFLCASSLSAGVTSVLGGNPGLGINGADDGETGIDGTVLSMTLT